MMLNAIRRRVVCQDLLALTAEIRSYLSICRLLLTAQFGYFIQIVLSLLFGVLSWCRLVFGRRGIRKYIGECVEKLVCCREVTMKIFFECIRNALHIIDGTAQLADILCIDWAFQDLNDLVHCRFKLGPCEFQTFERKIQAAVILSLCRGQLLCPCQIAVSPRLEEILLLLSGFSRTGLRRSNLRFHGILGLA